MTTDRAERLRVVNRVDDRGPDRGRRVLTSDERGFLQTPQCDQMAYDFGRPHGLVGLCAQSRKVTKSLASDVLVRVGPRNLGKHGRIVKTGSRGPAHTRL